MKLSFTLVITLTLTLCFSQTYSQLISISTAIEDLNNDFIPDRLGDTVEVSGVIYTPRLHNVVNQYFIDDGTAGVNVFMPAPPTFNWNLGDLLQITGTVAQYSGLTEIIALDSSSWVLQGSGNPLPEPIILTISQYLADPEGYEGSLIAFRSLTMISGTWPAPGFNATVNIGDGTDSLQLRINRFTDVDDNPEPVWPKDIMGIAYQFTSNNPPVGGYQLMPRFYTDFLPPGTVPVAISAFTAALTNEVVLLEWTTATETNNKGFEIQRKLGDLPWITLGFKNGAGNSSHPHVYSFDDDVSGLNSRFVRYRLKQIDFDGRYEYSKVVEVEVNASIRYSLEQNYPNPFNPSTNFVYSIPQPSHVQIKVYDVLSNEVKTLISEEKPAGRYEVDFSAGNLPSGVYFYQLRATPEGGQAGDFVETKKMILMK